MEDPVVAADGFSYERADISEWLEHNDTSPKQNTVMDKTLVPNKTLRSLIMYWRELFHQDDAAGARDDSCEEERKPVE